MNKDKELEELFLAQKPHFDDNEAFMASLNKRLDAVEYVKQHQEATIRRQPRFRFSPSAHGQPSLFGSANTPESSSPLHYHCLWASPFSASSAM